MTEEQQEQRFQQLEDRIYELEYEKIRLEYKLGKYCGLGYEPPFDTVILIDENNLRDVE